MVGEAPCAPAGAGGTILQPGQGGSSSLTACSDHSRAQSQSAFVALPRSPALAHPARQPLHPRRQLRVCLGSPPARAELSTARLFCAARGRISCRLISIFLSFHRMPPDFLRQARSFHQGGGPAARSSLARSWGRGLVVNEQMPVHAWSWSGGKDLPNLPRWMKHGHAVPSAALAAEGDARRAVL